MIVIYHVVVEKALKAHKSSNISIFTLCDEEFYKYGFRASPKDFWPFLERYINLTKNKTLKIKYGRQNEKN